MSSKILPSGQTSAPVFWRMVSAGDVEAAKRPPKASAEPSLTQLIEDARREGFTAGLAAAREQAQQELRPTFENLTRSISELARMRDVIHAQATNDLVHLAVTIAARIIHRDVTIDPDALAGLVTAAFAKLQSREIHRVRMHPDMEPVVRKCLEHSVCPKNLVLDSDPALNPGDLLFETSQGALDASVDTQLREIQRGLIDKLER